MATSGSGSQPWQPGGVPGLSYPGTVHYETVAAAYRDLERASARLVLIDRLADLLGPTRALHAAPVPPPSRRGERAAPRGVRIARRAPRRAHPPADLLPRVVY